MAAEVRIGTQGWDHDTWVGSFYPPDSRPPDLLALYARAFSTVEVDATFYGAPAEPVIADWRDGVPRTFRFALKVPQEITHERRLRDADDALARFLARASLLGERLDVLLLQMPPDWAPTFAAREDLDRFLATLPPGRRWAIEFRDPRWLEPPILDRLRGQGVALACADGRWIKRERVLDAVAEPTAPFAYVRWVGADHPITAFSRVRLDRDAELETWAAALRALVPRVNAVYGYVSNRYQGHAPASARSLQRLLGVPCVEPDALREPAEPCK